MLHSFLNQNISENRTRLLPKRFDPTQIEWLSPKKVYPNAVFFDGNLSNKDILQGSLGSCWILSNVLNLVNYPFLLFNIFNPLQIFKEVHENTFIFYFYSDDSSEQVAVKISDKLPFFKNKKANQIFVQSADNPLEFWPALLEKAYIQFSKSSYRDIDIGGDPSKIVHHFVGSNNIVRYFFSANDFIQYNRYVRNKKTSQTNQQTKQEINEDEDEDVYIASCARSCDSQTNEVDRENIILNHAYSLSLECSRKDETVTVFNPWGYGPEYIFKIAKDDIDNDGNFKIHYKNLENVFNYFSATKIARSLYSGEVTKIFSKYLNDETRLWRFRWSPPKEEGVIGTEIFIYGIGLKKLLLFLWPLRRKCGVKCSLYYINKEYTINKSIIFELSDESKKYPFALIETQGDTEWFIISLYSNRDYSSAVLDEEVCILG